MESIIIGGLSGLGIMVLYFAYFIIKDIEGWKGKLSRSIFYLIIAAILLLLWAYNPEKFEDVLTWGIIALIVWYFFKEMGDSLIAELQSKFQKKYPCHLRKTVYHRSLQAGEELYNLDSTLLTQKVYMAFPPYNGLSITADIFNKKKETVIKRPGEESLTIEIIDTLYSDEIESVRYDIDDEIFTCETKPRFLIPQNKLGAVLYDYVREGWEIFLPSKEALIALSEWEAKELKRAELEE